MKIIAEIAQGYEGSVEKGKMLCRGAIRSGADEIKIQIIFADDLSIPNYQYHKLFKSLEMNEKSWRSIVAEVKEAKKHFYLMSLVKKVPCFLKK